MNPHGTEMLGKIKNAEWGCVLRSRYLVSKERNSVPMACSSEIAGAPMRTAGVTTASRPSMALQAALRCSSSARNPRIYCEGKKFRRAVPDPR